MRFDNTCDKLGGLQFLVSGHNDNRLLDQPQARVRILASKGLLWALLS